MTETVELWERKTGEAPTREVDPERIPGIEKWILPLLLIEGGDMEFHTHGGGD